MTAPICPHVDADGQPICRQPMRNIGPGVWDCNHLHGSKVKRRKPRAFPDIPRAKELAKKYEGGAR